MTKPKVDAPKNRLYYGDNLDVLQTHIKDESVHLVYLDPPFNSNRNYNVIFGKHLRAGNGDAAQIEAFADTWVWTPTTDQQYQDLISGGLPNDVANALIAMRTLLTENDAMAYLVNMAPRLVELHRVLKPTGSLYLHCDSTMSHYLKVMLDAIFSADRFRDEVIWQRHNARSVKQAIWPRLHDVVLYYVKGDGATFHPTVVSSGRKSEPHDIVTGPDGQRYRTKDLTGPGTRNGETGQPWRGVNPTSSGRHWRVNHTTLGEFDAAGRLYWQKSGMPRELAEKPYLPEERTFTVGDVWTDIDSINAGAAERLGYPTQKPLALMERILAASSNPGDVVLDPFCGCGTTIDAAQRMGRQWVGIDITYISIDLIQKRLKDRFGDEVEDTFEVSGIPRDKEAALALFSKSPFDFERWAVSLVNGQPNQKQVGDKGVDGLARFPLGDPNKKARRVGQILISVKGGKNLGPTFVRDLLGTVSTQHAEMGLLITMSQPTRGMVDAANHAGTYTHPANGQTFPKVQIITVSELLAGSRPKMPLTILPYIHATRAGASTFSGTLFDQA